MANNPYVNKVIVNNQTIIDLSGDTVAAAKLLDGYTAHDKSGAQITGNIQSLAAQTITPALTEQEIAAGKYLSGNQTIAPITASLLTQLDPDFVAENIKKDVNLFGLIGTLSGANAVTGTFTTGNTNEKYKDIVHNLGETPNFVAVFNTGGTFRESYAITSMFKMGSSGLSTMTQADVLTLQKTEQKNYIISSNETATSILLGATNNTMFFYKGMTYRWIVAKF